MIKNIKYKGITRLPSDHDSWDGEVEEMVNVHNKNGELRPMVPPDTIGSIDGDFIFVHKNRGYEHFIAIKANVITAYNYANGIITLIGEVDNIFGETLTNIQSVGNTIIILTDKEVKYYLWDSALYRRLGNSIPFPVINFGVQAVNITGVDESFTVDSAKFASDFKQLRDITGYDVSRTGTQTTDGSSSGAYRDTSGVVPEYIRIDTEKDTSVISVDLENLIKGRINSKLQSLEKSDIFVFPFFVRYAVRLYDGSLVRHSQPFLMLPTKFYPFEAGINNLETDYKVYLFFNNAAKLVLSHAAIDISNYKDIISGIDVFISAPIYTYIQDGGINGLMDNPFSETSSPDKFFGGIYKGKKDIIESISSVGNFYKITSISIDDLNKVETNKQVEIKNLSSILLQEPMTDDFHTHNKITADSAFVYNNKLHLSGVSQSLFPGFSIGENCKYFVSDLGTASTATIDVGPQPFVFYPDRRANLLHMKTSSLVEGVTQYRNKMINLTEHKYLNGAFYVDPDLNNITNDAPFEPIALVHPLGKIENMPDKIFVSEHQNPFYFPVTSRVTLPVGRIIALASNTQALSQGQFGQFPLYAFTDDGIWALEVSAEGKYFAKQPVSREVVVNNKILQLGNQLAFISKKGLMILSGSETECISDIISDNNTRSSKLDIYALLTASSLTEMQSIYLTDNVEVFIKDCTLAYEYLNGRGRIYMINKAYSYAYVFDVESKTWGKVSSTMKNVVNNYPDCYAQKSDNSIVNLSTIGKSVLDIPYLIITRPLKLEDVLFNLKSFVHRGICKGYINTVVYASRNGIDYMPIASGTKAHMRMTGSPFRYYKIALTGYLTPDDVLSGATVDMEPRYTYRLR
jgi:hypothetical protein